LTVFLLLFTASVGFAGETEGPKLKSLGLATALALDPIPGDALFYAGRTTQGSINAGLGLISGALFWWGALSLSTCHFKATAGNNGEDWGALGYGIAAYGGGLVYFPMLIWDAIGGLQGVAAHNKKVKENQSLLQSIHPLVSVAPDGAVVGMQVNF